MDQELARRLPAQIVKVPDAPHLPRRVRWRTDQGRAALERLVAERARLGQVARTYRLGQDERGWWADVTLLAVTEPAPRWRRPLLWGVGSLATVTGLSWLLVLAAQAFMALLPWLIGGSVVLAVAGYVARRALGGPSISVTQIVKFSLW